MREYPWTAPAAQLNTQINQNSDTQLTSSVHALLENHRSLLSTPVKTLARGDAPTSFTWNVLNEEDEMFFVNPFQT